MKAWAVSVLCCIGLQGHAQFNGIAIDGVISFQERNDTTDFKNVPTGNENFLVKKSKGHYYVGIHNSTVAASNVILYKDDRFVIIHISACSGRAIYRRVGKDSVAIVKPLRNVTEHPRDWDVRGVWVSNAILKTKKDLRQQNAEMTSCLKDFGYMASTIDMGSYRDAEILLDRKAFQGYRMLIQNTEAIPGDTLSANKTGLHPPAGFKGAPKQMQMLLDAQEGTAIKIQLDVERWIEL